MMAEGDINGCDRQELNDKAHLLLERVQRLEVGKAFQEKLTEECKELRAAIKQMREESSCLPSPPAADEESCTGLLLRQRYLQAEVTVLKTRLLPDDRDWTEEEHVKRRIEGGIEQLRDVLKSVKQERFAASKELESEKNYLKESSQLLETLKRKTMEKNSSNDESDHIRSKTQELQESCEELKQHLESFVDEYFLSEAASGDDEGSGVGQRKTRRSKSLKQTTLNFGSTLTSRKVGLTQFIEALLTRSLDQPHDPYLPMSRVSQENFLLLLRSGAVQRHPTKHSFIRLTPFHH